MNLLRKLLCCSICTFLCISSSLNAQESQSPELSAALCELACWSGSGRAAQNALLMEKAAYLEAAGEYARAYETLCRISSFSLDAAGRTELLRRKLLLAYEAEDMDSFLSLLDEAAETSFPGLRGLIPEGRPRKKSGDAAMLLSILPGAGFAYSGQWPAAGKDFLVEGSILALGAGCIASGLYLAAFLGGGMLLYEALPRSTEKAIRAASSYNAARIKEFYLPVFESLKQSPKIQEKPMP